MMNKTQITAYKGVVYSQNTNADAGCKVEHCSGFYRILYRPSDKQLIESYRKFVPTGWRTVAIGRDGKPPFAFMSPYYYDINDFSPGSPNGKKPTGDPKKDVYWDESIYGDPRYNSPEMSPVNRMCNPRRFSCFDSTLASAIDIISGHSIAIDTIFNLGKWTRGVISYRKKAVLRECRVLAAEIPSIRPRPQYIMGRRPGQEDYYSTHFPPKSYAVPLLSFGLHTMTGFPLPERFNELVHLVGNDDKDAEFFRYVARFTKTFPMKNDIGLIREAEKISDFVDSTYAIFSWAPDHWENSDHRVFINPIDLRIDCTETRLAGLQSIFHGGRHALLDGADLPEPDSPDIEWLREHGGVDWPAARTLISNMRKLVKTLTKHHALAEDNPGLRVKHMSWIHKPSLTQLSNEIVTDKNYVSVLERKWPYKDTWLCLPASFELAMYSESGKNIMLRFSDDLSTFQHRVIGRAPGLPTPTMDFQVKRLDELGELLQEMNEYSGYGNLDDTEL